MTARLIAGTALILAALVSSASAETLMMPNRDALKGTPVVVWGVTTNPNWTAGNPTTYTIDFGDGTQTVVTNVTDRSYIAVTHTYNSQDTFTATLSVTHAGTTEMAEVDIQVFDPAPAVNSAEIVRNVRINMAIQDGLRWLWVNQGGGGNAAIRAANRAANFPAGTQTTWSMTEFAWGGSVSFDALVVLAFENHGYLVPNDNSMPTGLYEKYVVRRGLNRVIQSLSTLSLTAAQSPAGNPCVGIPAEPAPPCTGLYLSEQAGYSAAIAMMPIAASGALNRQSTETTGYTQNKTFREILQRQTNALAWGQTNSNEATNRGGWRYGFNSGFDGSSVGWDILALLDVAAAGITVPAFVKTEFAVGFNNALNNDGSFDYTADANAATRQSPNVARTGAGLQGFFYLGTVAPFAAGSKGEAALTFVSNRWNGQVLGGDYTGTCGGSGQNKGCSYAMFNVFKALKLQGVATLPGVTRPAGPGAIPAGDWYADYQDWLVTNQSLPNATGGGNWPSMAFSCCGNSPAVNAAIAELILSGVALVLPDADRFAKVGLAPATGLSNPGPTASHTVTATAESESGAPVPGATVAFDVLSGPNAGATGSGVTGADGKASFTYLDTGGSGTDRIQAHIGPIYSNVVTMVWNSPPVLTAVGPAGPVEATGPAGAPVPFSATATDPEDGIVAPICETAEQVVTSGSTLPLGTTLVTCTATDSGGLQDVESFSVTVVDTTPPVVAGASVTAEATGPGGANVDYAASATDLVDGAVAVTCSPASGSLFALGTTTVSCSATDSRGNLGTGSLPVTVVDTTPPTVTGADVTAEATGPDGASVDYTASATDLVDGEVTVSCSPVSGSLFALGPTTVNCSATDSHENTGTGSLTVTVVDTTPPSVTGADVTAEATGPFTSVAFSASATDLVDGDVAVDCVPPSGAAFALGNTSVSCSATDSRGNTGTGSLTVTVIDTTPPALTLPADITEDATSAAGDIVTFSATATDLVDGIVAVACLPPSGSVFPIASTIVNCSATDSQGNTNTGSFTVTVVNTPPVAGNDAFTVFEDTPLMASVAGNDSDAQGHTLTWTVVSPPANGTLELSSLNGSFRYTPNPNYYGPDGFTYRVNDGIVDSIVAAQVVIGVTPVNDPPVVLNVGGKGNEGSAIGMAAFVADLESDPLSYAWSVNGPAPCAFDNPALPLPNLTCSDNGVYTTTVVVSDGEDAAASSAQVAVANVNPVITGVTVPLGPQPIGNVTVSAPFTDAGTNDTHTCTIDWDDGAGPVAASVAQGAGSGTCTGTRALAAGVHAVTVTVVDDDGGSDSESATAFIIVYDARAFVTGAGWYTTPVAAAARNPRPRPRTDFRFTARYRAGDQAPNGQTSFEVRAEDLEFDGTSYNWLVVTAGCMAQLSGTGQLNGVPGYTFLLTVKDGRECSSPAPDAVRIKITGPEGVVYDTTPGAPDDIGPESGSVRPIQAGALQIHRR